jgi:metal-dependent amidase/aminoacylase/carboxypeptidase family protein
LVNGTETTRLVAEAANEVVGSGKVIVDLPPCMGSEDFAYYAEEVPATFWCLGVCRGDAAAQPRLHQSTYDFPDDALPIGIRMHCESAVRFLQRATR